MTGPVAAPTNACVAAPLAEWTRVASTLKVGPGRPDFLGMLMHREPEDAGAAAEPMWSVVVPRILGASVAAPHDPAAPIAPGTADAALRGLKARVDVAQLWAELAMRQPASIEPGDRPPLGFSMRPDGAAQDALLTHRALAELAELIDEAGVVEMPALFQLRAELLIGWNEFDRAAVQLRRALVALAACDDEPGSREWAAQIREQLAAVEAAWLPRASRRERVAMEEAAERMSRGFVQAFSPVPPELFLHECDAPPVAIEPRLQSVDRELLALGLERFGWLEDLDRTRTQADRGVVGVWRDATGESVVGALAVPAMWETSVSTVLSDGRILVTSDRPGRFSMQGGPTVDLLNVNLDGSCRDLLAVHRVRVQAELVKHPELSVVPVRTADEFLSASRREWEAKKAFRLAEGMSEAEARAIPYPRPEFVGLVRAATRRRVHEKAVEAGLQPSECLAAAASAAPRTPCQAAGRRRWFGRG